MMDLFAEPETIEKVKKLSGKTVSNEEYGEGKVTYILKVTERQSDHGLAPGDYVVVQLKQKKDSWKIENTDFLYEGEKGLQRMLSEWKEA